jgi:hypothetical protein
LVLARASHIVKAGGSTLRPSISRRLGGASIAFSLVVSLTVAACAGTSHAPATRAQPAADPADRELADELAGCAAAFATNIRTVQETGDDAQRRAVDRQQVLVGYFLAASEALESKSHVSEAMDLRTARYRAARDAVPSTYAPAVRTRRFLDRLGVDPTRCAEWQRENAPCLKALATSARKQGGSCDSAALVAGLRDIARAVEPPPPVARVAAGREEVDGLARCAALYVGLYRMTKDGGQPDERFRADADRFYEAAAVRSSREFARERFEGHYLSAVRRGERLGALQGPSLVTGRWAQLAEVNAGLDDCALLKTSVGLSETGAAPAAARQPAPAR